MLSQMLPVLAKEDSEKAALLDFTQRFPSVRCERRY